MLSAKHFQVMRLQVQADAIRCLFSSNAVQNLSNYVKLILTQFDLLIWSGDVFPCETGSSAATSASELPARPNPGDIWNGWNGVRSTAVRRDRTRLSAKARPFRSSSSLALGSSDISDISDWQGPCGFVSWQFQHIATGKMMIIKMIIYDIYGEPWGWVPHSQTKPCESMSIRFMASRYASSWNSERWWKSTVRSGDDWELGSWQPYNPEWPGLQQATHFGTAQPLLIACSSMWKNMRKFPPWPGYRTWCSSQHTCHPHHPLLEILREMTEMDLPRDVGFSCDINGTVRQSPRST